MTLKSKVEVRAAALRHAGKVPAIVYGAGSEAGCCYTRSQYNFHALKRSFSYINLELELNGKTEQVVLRDFISTHSAPKYCI